MTAAAPHFARNIGRAPDGGTGADRLRTTPIPGAVAFVLERREFAHAFAFEGAWMVSPGNGGDMLASGHASEAAAWAAAAEKLRRRSALAGRASASDDETDD